MTNLYGEESERNISIFFSTLGIIPQNLEREVNTWLSLLKELLLLREGYKISVKFHPRMDLSIINFTSEKIIENFKNEINLYTGTSKTAEELIFKSQIVIGDTSSTLIWAQYFENKRVFSLSFSGFINNSDMRRYPKINVTSDYRKIIKMIKDKQGFISKEKKVYQDKSSLNDLMRKILNENFKKV